MVHINPVIVFLVAWLLLALLPDFNLQPPTLRVVRILIIVVALVLIVLAAAGVGTGCAGKWVT